jgi:hypothetical protein
VPSLVIYEDCKDCLFSVPIALMHLPRVVNERLIELVSAMFYPSTLERLTLSDPAKSTK